MELMLKLLFTFVAAFLIYLTVRLRSWWRYFAKVSDVANRIPGPKKHWLYGTIHYFPGPNEAGLAYIEKNVKLYQKFMVSWVGPFQPNFILFHPDVVGPVVTSLDYADKPLHGTFSAYSVVKSWLGEGLITGSGERWARNRRLLTPAFHFGVLKPYVKVFNDAANKLISRLAKASIPGQSVEIYEPVSCSTLDIVLKCAFSYEEGISGSGLSMTDYRDYVHYLASNAIKRFFKPIMMFDNIFYWTQQGREFRKACDYVHTVAREIIASRKEALKNSQPKKYPDFLDILLSARDKDGQGLSDREIREEVDTFLFAGHDTTASATSWTLYSLAKHPDIQEKARDEIEALMAGRDTEDLEWDDLNKLTYITQCIKEAMRLHTTVPAVNRVLAKPLVISDDVIIPEGSVIALQLYALHHNPLIWGEDYNDYRPDRFEPENRKNAEIYGYIPFSAGPRNCIGQNFALNELRIIISKFLHKFKFSLDPHHKVERSPEMVMRSKTGIKMFLTPLNASAES